MENWVEEKSVQVTGITADTYPPKDNLERSASKTVMFLERGRKLKYPEKNTQKNMHARQEHGNCKIQIQVPLAARWQYYQLLHGVALS